MTMIKPAQRATISVAQRKLWISKPTNFTEPWRGDIN